jgi:hypothetical protein
MKSHRRDLVSTLGGVHKSCPAYSCMLRLPVRTVGASSSRSRWKRPYL